jgi:hypothetical protein
LPSNEEKPIEQFGNFVSMDKTVCSAGLDREVLKKSEVRFNRKKNSMLLICTDGIVDQKNSAGTPMDVDNLKRQLDAFRRSTAWEQADRIMPLADQVMNSSEDYRQTTAIEDDRLVVALDLARITLSS